MAFYILVVDFHDPHSDVEYGMHKKGSLFKQIQKRGTFVTGSKEPVEGHVIIVNNIPTSSLAQLNVDEFQLLLAIPLPEINRITVYMDKQWIREGLILSPGSPIYICNHKNISNGSEGGIRYKGNLPGKRGIWFGIELAPQHAGEGTSDGSFRHERFFTCSEDCAIFVSIFRIRKDEHYYRNRNSSPDLRGDEELNSFDLDSFPFKLEERVVWISDDGPENGTIKWIGRLPESNDGAIVVGVYFDQPVGSGTGRYKGRQLFDTPRGHASLMPPLGLMKYTDFYVEDSNVSDARSLSDYRDDTQKDGYFTSLETSPPSWQRNNDPDIIQSSTPTLRARDGQPPHHYQTRSDIPRTTFSTSDYGTDHQFPSRPAAFGTTATIPPFDSRIHGFSSPPPSDYGTDIHSQGIPTLPFKFDIGSRVYASVGHKRYGIIRYIGDHPNNPTRKIAGIEMEIPDSSLYTDGVFAGEKRFPCQPNRAFFIYLDKCHPDDRGSYYQ